MSKKIPEGWKESLKRSREDIDADRTRPLEEARDRLQARITRMSNDMPKKIRYENCKTTHYMNISEVLDFYAKPRTNWLGFWKKDQLTSDHYIMGITRENRKNLATLFGKAYQHYIGSHRNWVWRFEHEGHVFWLLCSTKGTTLEVEIGNCEYGNWPKTTGPATVSFIKWLYAKLIEVEPLPKGYLDLYK